MTKKFNTVLHRTPFASNRRLVPYRSRTRRARSLCRKSKSSATSPARSQHTKATTNAITRTTTKKRRTSHTQKGNTGSYYCVDNYEKRQEGRSVNTRLYIAAFSHIFRETSIIFHRFMYLTPVQ